MNIFDGSTSLTTSFRFAIYDQIFNVEDNDAITN